MRSLVLMMAILPTVMAVPVVSASEPDALPEEVRTARDDWALVGEARLRKYFFHVYDGFLWAPAGEWSWEQPFVLDFEYARSLDGDDIAERGAKEMQALGHCEAYEDCWLEDQRKAFPDVDEGDRLAGWYQPGGPVRFYVNGELQHEVEDPDFARAFFDIWLSPDTSEPGFREDLLGQ